MSDGIWQWICRLADEGVIRMFYVGFGSYGHLFWFLVLCSFAVDYPAAFAQSWRTLLPLLMK